MQFAVLGLIGRLAEDLLHKLCCEVAACEPVPVDKCGSGALVPCRVDSWALPFHAVWAVQPSAARM